MDPGTVPFWRTFMRHLFFGDLGRVYTQFDCGSRSWEGGAVVLAPTNGTLSLRSTLYVLLKGLPIYLAATDGDQSVLLSDACAGHEVPKTGDRRRNWPVTARP